MRMRPAILFLLLALVLPAAAEAAKRPGDDPEAQLKFGVDMAKRGLWSEALFRFRQAEQLDPSNFRVWNNLAVAYEANGMFDEALDAYQTALRMEPSNRELRRNYSRFVEFYQSFRPEAAVEEESGQGESGGGTSDPEASNPDETAAEPAADAG